MPKSLLAMTIVGRYPDSGRRRINETMNASPDHNRLHYAAGERSTTELGDAQLTLFFSFPSALHAQLIVITLVCKPGRGRATMDGGRRSTEVGLWRDVLVCA